VPPGATPVPRMRLAIVSPMAPESPPLPPPVSPSELEPWAAEPGAVSPEGVDLTLIRWTLSLTPLQRLELLQDWVDGLAELRRGRAAER